MASKYRIVGPLGHGVTMRDFKRWVLVFSDGDELCLSRKRYAWNTAKAMLARGSDIHIYEETVMRSIFANGELKEDTFRIEITERVKYELMEGVLAAPNGWMAGRWPPE